MRLNFSILTSSIMPIANLRINQFLKVQMGFASFKISTQIEKYWYGSSPRILSDSFPNWYRKRNIFETYSRLKFLFVQKIRWYYQRIREISNSIVHNTWIFHFWWDKNPDWDKCHMYLGCVQGLYNLTRNFIEFCWKKWTRKQLFFTFPLISQSHWSG